MRDHGRLPDGFDVSEMLTDASGATKAFDESLLPYANAIRAGLLQRAVRRWIADDAAFMGFRESGSAARSSKGAEVPAHYVASWVQGSDDKKALANALAADSVDHAIVPSGASLPQGRDLDRAVEAAELIEAAAQGTVVAGEIMREEHARAAVRDLGQGYVTPVTGFGIHVGDGNGEEVTAIGLYEARVKELAEVLEGWAAAIDAGADPSQLPEFTKGAEALAATTAAVVGSRRGLAATLGAGERPMLFVLPDPPSRGLPRAVASGRRAARRVQVGEGGAGKGSSAADGSANGSAADGASSPGGLGRAITPETTTPEAGLPPRRLRGRGISGPGSL